MQVRLPRRLARSAAALVAACWFSGCEHRGGVVMSMTSPGKTYSVELSGHLEVPSFPIDEHLVRVTARRGNAVLVSNHEVHFADWFDESFGDRYGPPSWPAENVLRFGPPIEGKGRATSLRVRNDSREVVSFLRVVCEQQLFLFFDVPPGSALLFPASAGWDSVEHPWVEVDGTWTSARPLQGQGQNFDVSRAAKSCVYEVRISGAGISIHPDCLRRP